MIGTVLITGGAGFIGSILTRLALRQGYSVRVLDRLLFGDRSLSEISGHERFQLMEGDLCDPAVVERAVDGADAVVHLAAIVGDPACKQNPDQAEQLNTQASRRLFDVCAVSGVRRFAFASTCSNYGIMDAQDGLLTEEAPLRPQSLYARQKVGFEEWLLGREGPSWTILRFATAYGASPRPRFDLTVNHFTRDMVAGQELVVFGKETWRPYGHVTDLARSVLAVLQAEAGDTAGQVFNVGDNAEQYTKEMVVRQIRKRVASGKVRYRNGVSSDPRTYRVDFSRIRKRLGFSTRLTLPDGIREIEQQIRSGAVEDPFDPIHCNA